MLKKSHFRSGIKINRLWSDILSFPKGNRRHVSQLTRCSILLSCLCWSTRGHGLFVHCRNALLFIITRIKHHLFSLSHGEGGKGRDSVSTTLRWGEGTRLRCWSDKAHTVSARVCLCITLHGAIPTSTQSMTWSQTLPLASPERVRTFPSSLSHSFCLKLLYLGDRQSLKSEIWLQGPAVKFVWDQTLSGQSNFFWVTTNPQTGTRPREHLTYMTVI